MMQRSATQQRSGASRALARGIAPRPAVRPARRVAAAASDAATTGRLPKWEVIYGDLKSSGLRTVTPSQAAELVASGEWVLLDVRPPQIAEKATPQGAQKAAMFQPVDYSSVDIGKLFRSAAFFLNGVTPTEMNPKFAEQVKAASGGKGVIVMCEAGGTLVPTANFPLGKPSRSLQAAWRVSQENLAPKVLHLSGGVFGWYKSNMPFDGEYDTSNVGRTPNAAEDGTAFAPNSQNKQ